MKHAKNSNGILLILLINLRQYVHGFMIQPNLNTPNKHQIEERSSTGKNYFTQCGTKKGLTFLQ